MKPLVHKLVLGAAGVGLFAGAFFGFAALSGAPRHQLPLVGSLFEPPALVPGEADAAEAGEGELPTAPAPRGDQALVEANASVLGAFVLPSPYSAQELAELEAEMENAQRQTGARLARIAERERQLDEEERRLVEHQRQLEDFRNQLEAYELELRGREEELSRDEAVALEREQASWAELATFFETGDAKKLVGKLAQFSPEEAARILRALDPEQASALINALPTESYRDYLDAFRRSAPPVVPDR